MKLFLSLLAFCAAAFMVSACATLNDARQRVDNINTDIDRQLASISRFSTSKVPADRTKLIEARNELNRLRADLPDARADVRIAERDVDDFLRANPQIQG